MLLVRLSFYSSSTAHLRVGEKISNIVYTVTRRPATNRSSMLNPWILKTTSQRCACLWVGILCFLVHFLLCLLLGRHSMCIRWIVMSISNPVFLKKEPETQGSWATTCLVLQSLWEMAQDFRHRLPVDKDPTLCLLPRVKNAAFLATNFFFLWTKASWWTHPCTAQLGSQLCVRVYTMCPLIHACVGGVAGKLIKGIAVLFRFVTVINFKLHLLIVGRPYTSGNLSLGTFLGAWSFCSLLGNSTHLFMLTGILKG